MTGDLLDRVLATPEPPPFALLHRPAATGDHVEVLVGEVGRCGKLGEVPLPDASGARTPRHDVLLLVPYRQVAERGFACVDDGTPLLALTVEEQQRLPLADALVRIPDLPTALTGQHFDVSDEEYADIVRRVVADEIGSGQGANFVFHRSFVADVTDYSPLRALSLFRRLIGTETGAYWTFVVHVGDRTLVGASPERHVSRLDGRTVMNPISGTYRYPPSGPTLRGVLDFLADRKEADELYMVVDEELKMMTGICEPGVRVDGPYLKEMARLAHTEYFIEGRSSSDVREALRATMFAPTVTGSPVENACRVIARYEPYGRGYYSGVLATVGRDGRGGRTLDSTILIRTADIDGGGRLSLGVGATLVRHSDPVAEVAETRVKAAGLLAAFDDAPTGFADHPNVREALRERNSTIADFWLGLAAADRTPDERLVGRRVLVVDAEDTFTSMLDHQLRSLGLTVDVRGYGEPCRFDDYDLVVLGPGPGDPRDAGDPKIARLREHVRVLLAERRPFLAVCLSHQVLCVELGLRLVRREQPNQGVQQDVDLFGERERVGFYNTFAAVVGESGGEEPETSSNPETGEIHALRAPRFVSLQFHPESVLTLGGPRILASLLGGLMPRERVGAR